MIQLKDDHPTFTACADLNEFARPIFNKFNLNYFQYIKIFKDGSLSCATNIPEWQQFCYKHFWSNNKPVAYSSPPQSECLDPNKYCFLWEPNLPAEPVGFAREFNIHNGITFVERHADYYTMMGFAAPDNNYSVINTYLNNIDVFTQFINKFQQEQSDLIVKLDSNKIIVPDTQLDQNLTAMLAQDQAKVRIPVCHKKINSYLTKREHECIKLLSKNFTNKQIARELSLSDRTVESYFNRIRQRFDLHSKLELIKLQQSITDTRICT